METVKKLFRRENFLPTLGPCMITFAVPLAIPGLTLTLVAFSDETGFSKFSALHVLGMVLLAMSGVLLVAGVIVRCTINKLSGRVNPLDEDGTMSISSSDQILGNVHSTHTAKTPHPLTDQLAMVTTKEPNNLAILVDRQASYDVEAEAAREAPLTPKSPGLLAPPERKEVALNALVSQREYSAAQDVLMGTARDIEKARPSPARGGACNFMTNSDSEAEKAEVARYKAVAETLPRDRLGMIRNMSTLTSSSSASSPAHSLYQSFDVEQDPAVDVGLPGRHVQSNPQVHQAVVSSGIASLKSEAASSRSSVGHTTANDTTTNRSPSEDEQPPPTTTPLQEKGDKFLYEDGSDVSDESAGRCFVSREQHGDGIPANSLTGTGSRLQARRTMLSGVSGRQDASSSSLDQQTSSTESPSHGTYSVRSVLSAELLDLKESSAGTFVDEDKAFSQHSLSPANQHQERSRSSSPVPLKEDVLRMDANHHVTVFGGSRTSASSAESTPAKRKPSLVESLGLEPRNGDVSQCSQTADANGSGTKRKKKNKKKKKRKQKDTSLPDDEHRNEHKPEAETQETGNGQLSPLRSIMHPQHHSSHHVHWPDDRETLQ